MRKVIVFITILCWTFAVRAQDYKTYQNYEFPAHWKLLAGQAVVNKFQGEPVFALTEGNYAKAEPRVTGNKYLADAFTIESRTRGAGVRRIQTRISSVRRNC